MGELLDGNGQPVLTAPTPVTDPGGERVITITVKARIVPGGVDLNWDADAGLFIETIASLLQMAAKRAERFQLINELLTAQMQARKQAEVFRKQMETLGGLG